MPKDDIIKLRDYIMHHIKRIIMWNLHILMKTALRVAYLFRLASLQLVLSLPKLGHLSKAKPHVRPASLETGSPHLSWPWQEGSRQKRTLSLLMPRCTSTSTWTSVFHGAGAGSVRALRFALSEDDSFSAAFLG